MLTIIKNKNPLIKLKTKDLLKNRQKKYKKMGAKNINF